jgi:hypothetical protein
MARSSTEGKRDQPLKQGNRVNGYVTNRENAESMPILDSLSGERQ